MRAAVFLDRDGTLNRCFPTADGRTTRPPQSVDELDLMEGAVDASERLRAAGFALLVVTNQPDVARGTQSRELVEAMNSHLATTLHLDGVATCYHDNADGCACRKPRPGLLLGLADAHGIDLGRSWMVGDRASDVGAGRAAGCRTVLVSTIDVDHGQTHRVTSLPSAADLILAHQTPEPATSGSRHAS